MERRTWIAQAYGYLVCLIAVVTLLITLHGLIDAGFRLASPMEAEFGYDPMMSSFEGFRAARAEQRPAAPGGQAAPAPTDAELRREYEAIRAARLAQSRFQARRSITTNGLLLVTALVLFGVHWRWLKREERMTAAPVAAA
ncbi:MAG: hypothetical protein M3Y31_09365 [Gemmatimonadota bacterium]|nr:hypothetical protein [Gemmatimonadota bacterium]